jgi:hypothetical protein
LRSVEDAAGVLKTEPGAFRAARLADYDAVFQAMRDAGAGALLFGSSRNFLEDAHDLAARA